MCFSSEATWLIKYIQRKGGTIPAGSQLEEYNRERVVHQPHLKSRPEKDVGLKGWGGEESGGVENWKIERTSGKTLATPLVQELSHGSVL